MNLALLPRYRPLIEVRKDDIMQYLKPLPLAHASSSLSWLCFGCQARNRTRDLQVHVAYAYG